MYKFTFIFRDEPDSNRIHEKVLNALVGLTPAAIRIEIFNRGAKQGYDLGFRNGVASGYKEGKMFLANIPRDPLE